MTHFYDLPEEVVLKIFKYISTSQLSYSISHVCQQWHRICQDRTLYKHLDLDSKLSLEVVMKIFQKYSIFVTSLIINGRRDTNTILRMVPSLENLQTLKVNPCSGCNDPCGQMTSEVNADLLSIILEKNTYLIGLWMIHSTIRPGYFKLHNNNLQELILKNAYYQRSIDERGILLQNSLRLLNLQGLIMNNSILSQVIMNNRKTLEILKLDVWEPQLGSNDTLMKAVGVCFNMKYLMITNLSFYRISDQAIKSLIALKRLCGVKFSRLENVTSSVFCKLFEKLHCSNLHKIHLSACDGLCSKVIRMIAVSCPHLVKIAVHQPNTLQENLIKSEDILYLASKCTRLQLLDLCYTHTSIGQSLTEIISFLPVLKDFKYCSNSGSADKDFLASIYNYLFINLETFNIIVRSNIHMDKYISGVRKKMF